MISLSNGHELRHVVASGALGFDGRGWFWEWPLRWLGLIKPELFTVVMKTVTYEPVKGNLRWWNPLTWLPWSPWSCVRFLPFGGVINKVGLTNEGIDWWCRKIGPKVNAGKLPPLIGSIHGTLEQCVAMAHKLNRFNLVGLEVNGSCPNKDQMEEAMGIVATVKAVAKVSRHPVLFKASVAQDYVLMARELEGIAQAMNINSVPWPEFAKQNPDVKNPLRWKNSGGVSGWLAQKQNWEAVFRVSKHTAMPVIAPSIMRYGDLVRARAQGAKAISYGAIHLRTPWKPTQIVMRERAEIARL